MSAFFIIDKSCYRRREEISMVRNFLLSNDWREAGQLGGADLVVFFACAGLRHLVDEKLKEIEDTGKMMKPGAELMVGSCLPGVDKERLKRIFKGKTITPTDFAALNDLPDIEVRIEAMPGMWGRDAVCQPLKRPTRVAAARMAIDNAAWEGLNFVMKLRSGPRLKRAAFRLKRRHTLGFSVAAGCSRKCAYCAKPLASGKVRSKPLDVVVKNISEGLRLGYRSFDLYADSIGVYGLDLGVHFGNLLDRILDIDKRFSVGLFDVHPQDFIRYFGSIKSLCRAGKLHYIHVPVQSGNERILGLMRRPCDVEDLAAKLAEIRRCGNVFMQSGMIAGFPGETDEEFEDTLRLLKRIDFDDVYVHYYCDMPYTEASGLPCKLDKNAMLRRLAGIERAGIHHDLAKTRHEWESNLAIQDRLEKQAPGHSAGAKAKADD